MLSYLTFTYVNVKIHSDMWIEWKGQATTPGEEIQQGQIWEDQTSSEKYDNLMLTN